MNKKILFGSLVGTFGATAIIGAGLTGGMYPEYVNYTSTKTLYDIQVKYDTTGVAAKISFSDFVKSKNEEISKMTSAEKNSMKQAQNLMKQLGFSAFKLSTETGLKQTMPNITDSDLNAYINATWAIITKGDGTKKLDQGGLIAGAVILSLSAVALIPTSIFLAKAIKNKE